MPEDRPKIPADIELQLIIECGHRCAVCGEPTSLDKAHIIPWGKKKEHIFENLIVLCAVCHRRSHEEKWDQRTVHEYKKNPWVARYRSVPDRSPRAAIELKLNIDPDKFGDGERERVLTAVSAVLDICPQDVTILSIRAGSIKVRVELPSSSVATLQHSLVFAEETS